MILFRCILPFSVSVNQMYGGGGGQKRFPSKKYKAWLKECPKLNALGIEDPVTIEYIFTWPCKRERDLTNYVKCAEDFLVNSGVIKDDNYKIVTKVLLRHLGVSKEKSGVEIIIRDLNGNNK